MPLRIDVAGRAARRAAMMRVLLISMSLFGGVAPSQVTAQVALGEWQAGSESENGDTLLLAFRKIPRISNEIVVTGTRREESALEVAGTVNVLEDGELATLAPLHAAEALNAVAGVNIHQGSGQEHLTAIRSPVLTGGAGAGSFLYLEDGVPLRAAGFGNVNGLFESAVEFAGGVEVVKGPGSVLYGSNAQHGLVNVVSRAPQPGTDLRVMASDDGQVAGRISTSGEKSRVSLNLAHDNGFRDDSGYDQQKFQWRHDDVFGAWTVTALTSVQNLNQETAGFLQEGPETYRDRELIEINAFPEAYRDAWSFRTQARLSRDVRDGELAVTPYARATEIEFLRHFVPGQAREEQRHGSVGVLSTYYSDNWLAGLDAEWTQGELFEFQDNPSRFSFVQGLHYDYAVEALVLSPYAQGEFKLGERTTATVGARLDYTRYAYDNLADTGVSGRFVRIGDQTDDFVTVTPKLDVVHRLSERNSLYGRLARGARAPQTSDLYSLQTNQVELVSGVPQRASALDPETLDMAEVGFKHRGGGLTLDVAAFAMKKDNFFFRNANGFNVTDGETEHYGVEVAALWEVTDWLRVNADITVAEHTYAFTDIVRSPSSSITDGDEVDSAPNTLGRLALDIVPTDDLRFNVEMRHVGEYFTDPGNTRSYPGHEVFGARADWQVSDGMGLFVQVRNLFDTRYADRADFAFGNDRYFPGRPRHLLVGLTQSLDFGL